ncbi:MAG: protein kinase [Pirellulales bacterium]
MSHELSSSANSSHDDLARRNAARSLAANEALRDVYLEEFLAAWIECGEQAEVGADAAVDPGEALEGLSSLRDESLEVVRRADQCAALLALAWPASGSGESSSRSSLGTGVPEAREPASRPASMVGAEQPRMLGRLEIRHRLGSGGMGQVFLAYDPLIRRDVAVKIPLPGHWQSTKARARFLREARAAGKLRHTNILPVYDSGESGEGCYIVSQFVPGPTLASWLKERSSPVPPKLAARIVAQLADAMAHAHLRGVLHRDLKPSNVLLMPSEHAEDEFPFEPLVADFGLAAGDFLDEATLSADGQLLGTAVYMSPEQAAGESDRIGPRTDVYALGLILYELLTDSRPFQRDTLLATLEAARTESPLSPRRLRPELARDLESICLYALRADPRRRYASAADFRDDLNRFLSGEPVRARRPRVWERLTLWSRRNPTVASLTLVLALGVLLAFVGVIWHGRELQQALDDSRLSSQRAALAERVARQRKVALEQEVYAVDMATAHRFWKAGDTRAAVDMLRRHLPNPSLASDIRGPAAVTSSLELDTRGWEWHYLWSKLTAITRDASAHQGAGYWVQYDSSGKKLLTAGADGFVRVFAVDGLTKLTELATGQGEVNGLDWHEPTGLLATAGDDGSVRLWRLASRELVRAIGAHEGKAFAVLFLDEGRRLATCGTDRSVKVWETSSGLLEREFAWHEADVEAIDVTRDGARLASASSDQKIRIWNWRNSRTPVVIDGDAGRLSCVAFSPDGALVAAGTVRGDLGVWDAATGQRRMAREALDGIQSLAWMSDGKTVVAATRGGVILENDLDLRRPEIAGGSAERKWQVDGKRIYRVAMSPEGQFGASIGSAGTLRVWSPRREAEPIREIRYAHPGVEAADLMSSEGDLLFADPNQVGVVKRATGSLQVLENTPLCSVRTVAAARDCRVFFLGTIEEGALIGQWDDPRSSVDFGSQLELCIWHAALTPDGLSFVVSDRKRIEITEIDTQRKRAWPAEDSYHFAISPDGRWLAFSHMNDVMLVDRYGQSADRCLKGHSSTIFAFAFSADGGLLATASGDRCIKIWDLRSNQEQRSLEGLSEIPTSLAFSLDSRTLFVAGPTFPAQLWHVPTGRRLFDLDVQLLQVFVGPAIGQLAGVEKHQAIWICDMPSYVSGPASN